MCGYIRRVTDSPAVGELLHHVGLGHLAEQFQGDEPGAINEFYPAFGGDPRRQIRKLIVPGSNGPKTVDATWWFDCQPKDATLLPGKRTTFNARNLESSYWRGALHHHRALVVATGLGESRRIDGKKRQFLVEGDQPFLLGALYRPFDNGCFSCAVITRDSHPRFELYHEKAFPCFIPADQAFVDAWLHGTGGVPSRILDYLAQPQITEALWVSPVQRFKGATTDLGAHYLEADS